MNQAIVAGGEPGSWSCVAGRSVKETTMPPARSAGASVAPTFITVLALLLACAVAAIVALETRPSGGLAVPAGSHVVHVDERDFGIHASQMTLPAGHYVFVDTNHGPSSHELVMWRTALPADRLPIRSSERRVNEDSPALTSVLDSGSSLNPGETRLLAATLDPGHYLIVCNLPGHFMAGMHVDITVTLTRDGANSSPKESAVSLIQLGPIPDAGMWADAGLAPKGLPTKAPANVGGAVVRAVEHNLAQVTVAPLALRLGARLARMTPGTFARIAPEPVRTTSPTQYPTPFDTRGNPSPRSTPSLKCRRSTSVVASPHRVQRPPLRSLQLEPVTRALAGPIRRIDALGDDAFDVVFATRQHVDHAAVQHQCRAPCFPGYLAARHTRG
jgi:uncharacterized cupredoxin-like copper-binding protein